MFIAIASDIVLSSFFCLKCLVCILLSSIFVHLSSIFCILLSTFCYSFYGFYLHYYAFCLLSHSFYLHKSIFIPHSHASLSSINFFWYYLFNLQSPVSYLRSSVFYLTTPIHILLSLHNNNWISNSHLCCNPNYQHSKLSKCKYLSAECNTFSCY